MPETIRLHLVEGLSEGDTKAQIEALGKVFELTSPDKADILLCASIRAMNSALTLKEELKKPLMVYCWDYYKWAHNGKHHDGLNWMRYAHMLRNNTVIVPSHAQQLRLKELLGVESHVVKTGFPTWDAEVTDEGFILDPVRYYPEENRDWAERAAQELGIPIVHSEHQFSLEEFRKLVSSCTFMTCCYREASTGGLTLGEGLYLGKPSLVSDSPYMGAKDYLGEFGTYFKHDDFEDLKEKMKEMWGQRKKLSTDLSRRYIKDNLTYAIMALGIFNISKGLLCEQKNR